MLEIYKTDEHGKLQDIPNFVSNLPEGCWLMLCGPTKTEIELAAKHTFIPEHDIMLGLFLKLEADA